MVTKRIPNPQARVQFLVAPLAFARIGCSTPVYVVSKLRESPGRLAQSGERLVYTEEVTGSSPVLPMHALSVVR